MTTVFRDIPVQGTWQKLKKKGGKQVEECTKRPACLPAFSPYFFGFSPFPLSVLVFSSLFPLLLRRAEAPLTVIIPRVRSHESGTQRSSKVGPCLHIIEGKKGELGRREYRQKEVHTYYNSQENSTTFLPSAQ